MSDFESFRREAGNQVVPPDFDDLVATSRRRSRTAAASAIVAVAAVVGVVAFGLQGVYGDQTAPVPPVGPPRSPTPTPTPTKDTSPSPDERPDRLTPTQIVNDRRSTIFDVAVSASSPETKAVIWQYCGEGRGCHNQQFALTVTDDNFKTSHDIALPGPVWPDMQAIGDDTFFVAAGSNGWLVRSDGSVSQVHVEQAARPLAAEEVFVQAQPTGTLNPYLALDPVTAVAHPISIPDMYTRSGSMAQNADGTLIGVVYNWAGTSRRWVIWSHDGGVSWDKHLLVEGSSDLVDVVPSAFPDDVMAVVQGGDGATLFPFDTVHRSTDGGATWETFDESRGDMAYLGWTLITPDGSLLVNIEGWSDERRGRPSAHPVGLYQSNGSDWADMRYVQDLPDSSQPDARASGFTLGDYAPTDSGVLRLWIYDSADGRLFESGPGIHTWAEVPAR